MLNNKTHDSPTDPAARISVKPGKARALNYLCSVAVNTAVGIISHIQADFADRRDSTHLPDFVRHLQTRLTANELTLRDFVADTGYSNGFNYAFLEQRGITPWIPVFGAYKLAAAGFTNEAEGDAFRCPTGKLCPFVFMPPAKMETGQELPGGLSRLPAVPVEDDLYASGSATKVCALSL